MKYVYKSANIKVIKKKGFLFYYNFYLLLIKFEDSF